MESLRVSLLGCGTVGTGVVKIISDNAQALTTRLGAQIEIVAVLVNDATKKRDPALEGLFITDNIEHFFDKKTDMVVELLGGVEPAATLIGRAIEHKYQIVTANKAVLAEKGQALLSQAKANSVDIAFEASVGGGIPILRALKDGLVSDKVNACHGIVNGTSNFILTAMSQEGSDYQSALQVAQDKGYAEADPTMDVGGLDAAQKLSIISLLSFNGWVPWQEIYTEGITEISDLDFEFANEMGYTIKHLAIGQREDDTYSLRVHPTLIPNDSMLGNVNGVFNAVSVESEGLGNTLYYGQGAGMMPTAVSAVSDLIEVGLNLIQKRTGLRSLQFETSLILSPLSELKSKYYLRFMAKDEPGVMGLITTVLGKHSISISSLHQPDANETGESVQELNCIVPILIMTHIANEKSVQSAFTELRSCAVIESAHLIRIESM
jgi:homoserine dehydrogenase